MKKICVQSVICNRKYIIIFDENVIFQLMQQQHEKSWVLSAITPANKIGKSTQWRYTKINDSCERNVYNLLHDEVS